MRHGIDDITLARAQLGKTDALEALVRRFQDPVYGLVARMLTRHPELVDDVAQEIFIKVIKAIGRFDASGSAKLSTWILTIATRTCLDVLRRPGVELEDVELLPLASDVPGPEHVAANKELGQKAMEAVAKMPAHQRAVLVLRAYHDLDYDEIAAALEIERGTVKSRLNRARETLRQMLAGGG